MPALMTSKELFHMELEVREEILYEEFNIQMMMIEVIASMADVATFDIMSKLLDNYVDTVEAWKHTVKQLSLLSPLEEKAILCVSTTQ
jgi:hypothetical protein